MTDETLWWIALGLGAVVAVVAVGLLQTFLGYLRRVERAAEAIWAAGKQVARNTQTTWMLTQTSERLDELTFEVLRHDDFLRSAGRR